MELLSPFLSRFGRARATSGSCTRLAVLLLLTGLALAPATVAGTIGMVCDDGSDSVVVFDADTNHVLGVVPLDVGAAVGDCTVSRDQAYGYVTDGLGGVWVIDLTASPPVLAVDPNPIVTSAVALRATLDASDTRLVVCGADASVSVVDVAARHEVSTFDLPSACSALDVWSL